MARQQMVLLRSPPASSRTGRRRVGEVAGNATAECAAVCCCMPCAVMDVVVLAAYKVPAGLVKKAMHKRKRQLLSQKKKKNDTLLDHGPTTSFDDLHYGLGLGPVSTLEEHLAKEEAEEQIEASKLEEEMWAQFNGTGFWRSVSQRHHLPLHYEE